MTKRDKRRRAAKRKGLKRRIVQIEPPQFRPARARPIPAVTAAPQCLSCGLETEIRVNGLCGVCYDASGQPTVYPPSAEQRGPFTDSP